MADRGVVGMAPVPVPVLYAAAVPPPAPAPSSPSNPRHEESAPEMERERGGEVIRRAADTDAQCTAASYAPGPCRVRREPTSGTVGSSQVKVMLSSESPGRLNARRIDSVKSL